MWRDAINRVCTVVEVFVVCGLGPFVSRIGVFGSYARGENSNESDLDVLVSFKSQIGLLKLIHIQHEMEDELGLSVDLITENSLKNPRLKRYILNDLIEIFHEKEQPYIS